MERERQESITLKERLETPPDWSKWQTMRVEKAGNKDCWLTLHYDPEFTSEELGELKVQKEMPFEVMMRMEDVNPKYLQAVFKKQKTDDDTLVLENNLQSQDKAILERQEEFSKSVEEIMVKANKSFFWHGWDSDPRVWQTPEREQLLKRNIENRSTLEQPMVNILPYGMGIRGGCISGEIKGKKCFTPQDYGQQMAEFINFFGWDKKIDLFGHSMGGIGIGWAASEIIDNERFRKTDGSLPDLRLWMMAPAYLGKANIFINRGLQLSLETLKIIPEKVRPLAKPIIKQINQYLLQVSSPETHAIQADVAMKSPGTVIETMRGLKYQPLLTPQQWRNIIDEYPVTIITSPADRVVSEEISQRAFKELTAEAIGLSEFKGKRPLMFSESALRRESDHYVAAMEGVDKTILYTLGKEHIELPLIALPLFLDKIPPGKEALVINYLADQLEEIKTESGAERKGKQLTRILGFFALIDWGIDRASLKDKEDLYNFFSRQEREGMLTADEASQRKNLLFLFQNTILKYYKLLWDESTV